MQDSQREMMISGFLDELQEIRKAAGIGGAIGAIGGGLVGTAMGGLAGPAGMVAGGLAGASVGRRLLGGRPKPQVPIQAPAQMPMQPQMQPMQRPMGY